VIAMPTQASEPRPLSLSDSELSIVMAACAPLSPVDRDDFLRQVACALVALPVIGDGAVARVCRALQGRYWQPPELDGRNTAGGKYAR
jgi:hypothetical protein